MMHMSKNVWNEYYSKKSIASKVIEHVNESYFSRMFEVRILHIIGGAKGKFVMEAACGSGILSLRLAQKGAKVTVLDISENALKTARQNLNKHCEKSGIIKADILKMPFDDNMFDVVWNQGVIEHFAEPENVVAEMYRATKKGGYIVIFVPAHLSSLHFIYKILERTNRMDLWPFDRQMFYKKCYLKNVMERAGCRDVTVKKIVASFGFSIMGYHENGDLQCFFGCMFNRCP